ncbi:MAG: hypothetical protein IJ733_07195, partial [Lachnospiraceae bacterium]|nr:hypothetical protein [Lachnospiraceae bacterium]
TKNMNIVVKAAEGQEAVGIYTNELDLRNTPHGKEIPFPCISWRMPRCMKRRGCSSWGIIMRWR